jgi:hypothetical protein
MKILKKNLTPIGKMMCESIGWKKTKEFIKKEKDRQEKEIAEIFSNSFQTEYINQEDKI